MLRRRKIKMKFKIPGFLGIMFLTALIMSIAIAPFPSTTAQSSTRIYLEPSNNIYTTDTASIGFKFNVTVWVEKAPEVGGAQVYLEFNDSIIRVTRWFEPKTDSSYIFYGKTTTALPTPPNDPGYVHLAQGRGRVLISVSLFPPPPDQTPGQGNGKICIFEFNVTAAPTDPGKYSSTLLIDSSDTYLLDANGGEVPNVVKENGYYEISRPGPSYSLTIPAASGGTTNPTPGTYLYPFGTSVQVTATPAANYRFNHWELNGTNIGDANPVTITMNANYILLAVFVYSPPEGARIFIDPPEIIKPEAVPCQTNFNINVSIDDIADMKACEFNLTYNTNIISVIGINFQSVGEQYPFISIAANDTAGYIWIKLEYSTAIITSNPTPLVTIIFHVQNLGATPLNLTNTKLTSSLDTAIPHSVNHGFFMALIRDVAVTNIALSRTWAYPGWPVNVTVTVKNKGNVSETFDVYAYYDNHVIGTKTITNLAPNQDREVTFEWDTTTATEGNYTIKAEAQQVPYEINTADNILINGQVWIMTQIHDVAIVNIVLSNDWIYQGWILKINVTAQNTGVFTETFDLNAYYNTTLIGTIHVVNLPPGNLFEAQFNLNTSTLEPCHNYTVSAETTMVPYEYNEANNHYTDGSFKVRFLGDLNGDDKVDLKDVYAVSMAFGSYPGHPRWNSFADINGDNKVDLKDVYIVSHNYGEGCP